ncbi:unnamed protein product, partial [Coregonus sp. 'balchen']
MRWRRSGGKTLRRSSGAVPVRETDPAIAPAISCLQTKPDFFSCSENSSGQVPRVIMALCVVESAVINVKEVVGGHVTVGCSFTLAGNNIKRFARGHVLVKTFWFKLMGARIIDDNRDGVFNVTIKNLMKSDSGTYWCGVERFIKDTYQEVHLIVTDAPPTPTPSPVTSRPQVSTTFPNLSTTSSNLSTTFLPSGDISVGPSQRAAAKHSARPLVPDSMTDNQDPDIGTITNPIYATATNQNPDTACDITTIYATATNPCPDDIYSNVQDSVTYATVNFPRDPACLHYATVNFPRDPACLHYATVNFPRDPACLHYNTVS